MPHVCRNIKTMKIDEIFVHKSLNRWLLKLVYAIAFSLLHEIENYPSQYEYSSDSWSPKGQS